MSKPQRIALSDDLLTRLRARDEIAYGELVERVGPSLVHLATQMLRSKPAAEDIVQDVFYRIWRQGERFSPKGTVVAYLFTAVRNRALHALEHERVVAVSHTRLAAEAVDDEERSLAPAADLRLESEEDLQRLRRVVATLTEHQRTAFLLRYDQGLSIPEIAEVLGISPKGAEQLMTRGRRLLRERFLASDQPAE